MEFIEVAYIRKNFGLKGQAKAESLTSFPKLRFKKGQVFFLGKSKEGKKKEVTLSYVNLNGPTLILGFNEITTPEEIDQYRGCYVYMDKEEAKVPEGYFRYSDLTGCLVIDIEKGPLGKVDYVQTYSPKANLIVKKEDGKKIAIPFVDTFVKEVDLDKKTIQVKVIEGMI